MPIFITAREYIQYKVDEGGETKLSAPQSEEGTVPEKPNVYTDGSLHNPTSRHWQVGGMGIFWPERELQKEPLEQHEMMYLKCQQQTFGTAMWGTFTALRGSSTRCELATALIAMLRQRPVHIGTDSLALVRKGTAYLEHMKTRRTTTLKREDGTLILGGRTSHLHRPTPWRQRWKLMKDGDLWQEFGRIAETKNPNATKLSKVKGHATWQMISDGKVKAEDAYGNDKSDQAAENGVTLEQPQFTKIAKRYANKHKQYKDFMKRIHTFIVKTKKADRKLREDKKKEEDPFATQAAGKATIPKALHYAEDAATELFRCKVRRIGEEEGGSRSEMRETQSIANFISQIEWAKEVGEGGGITWLELYIWFRMRSPKIDEDPLATSKALLHDITVFKSRVRRVATFCINEEQEWVLDTSYARERR